MARDNTLKGFQLAGADKKFAVAKAEIVGDTVEVTTEHVSAPLAVRYGFLERPTQEEMIANGCRADWFGAKYSSAPWLMNIAFDHRRKGRCESIEFLGGVIDDVRVYDRPLTRGEVRALYNQNEAAAAAGAEL